MLELTKEECLELEDRVTSKMYSALQKGDKDPSFYETILRVASRATITTIREYERMQAEKKDRLQSAE